MVAHGLEELPPFLSDEKLDESILPRTLAWHMNLAPGEPFELISPHRFNHLLGEQPRSITLYMDRMIQTDVPEADSFHLWMRMTALQNLLRQRSVNKIRLYGTDPGGIGEFIESKYKNRASIQYWSQRHQALVWSLSMENSLMLFLFISMTALVSLCITGGLSILYSKMKIDFASFWILGAGQKQLERANLIFLGSISLATVSTGLILGLITLILIDQFGGNVFSEQFVDQKIPVNITWKGIALSFSIPCAISLLFCRYSFYQFKRDTNYLEQIRATGF